MKIALVTPYWSPVRGGITTYVQELAKELRRIHAINVPVIAREGRAEANVTVLGGTAMQFVRRAAIQLERLRPDAVHAHGHWYALEAGLRYRRRHPETRVVFTLHTPFPPLRARRFGLRLLLSKANFVTGVSADLLGITMRTIGIRTRTRVTPPGVSIQPVNPLSIEEFLKAVGLENRSPLIGYVGRLVWERKVQGVTQLIRAMKTVRMSFPSVALVVAGDGPYLRSLREFANAEVPGGVVFVGDVQDPVACFYGAVDLYAHISFQEGMPLAVLEAMASGKPVVASNIGGIPEVVRNGQNGFLVSGSTPELAARIVEVLSSPDLMLRIGKNAMAEVAARFTWTSTVGRFLPLYGLASRRRIAITVDLEQDPYATETSFRGAKEGMPKLLELFEKHRVRATVFTTSDVCDRLPEVVEEIVRRQHPLECHGESHDVEYISKQTYEWQFESLRRATETLKRHTGLRPRGFRAPNFSANGDTIRVLEALGYEYDSSVLPGRRVKAKRMLELLDFRMAPRDPYRPSRDDPAIPGISNLWELPVTENPLAPGGPIGLGYLNAYGVEKTIEAIARSSADPCIFLVHPWELVSPPAGRIPGWMRTACSSDPSKLDALLTRLGHEHDLITIDDELAIIR